MPIIADFTAAERKLFSDAVSIYNGANTKVQQAIAGEISFAHRNMWWIVGGSLIVGLILGAMVG